MKGYLFGEKKCMHKFCPTCGSSLFVDPHMDDAELMVVNVCALLFVPLFCGEGGSRGGSDTAGHANRLATLTDPGTDVQRH